MTKKLAKFSYFWKDLHKKWCITDGGDKVSLKLAIVAINVNTLSNWRSFQKKLRCWFPRIVPNVMSTLCTSTYKHRHRRNVTSHPFTSLLFTSMSILTSLALINWKANTIHIHISKNSTFSVISLHFLLPLLLSIERQKQYKYINKAIQKVQSSSYIFVIDPDKFEIRWNQGYAKS